MCLLLKVFVRDAVHPLQFIFYIPALVALPTGVLLVVVGAGRIIFRTAVLLLLLFLSLPALLQDQPNLFARLPETRAGRFSVLCYNVQAYTAGEKEVVAIIKDEAPDVLCLVEGTFAGRAPQAVVRGLGRAYNWAVGNRLSIATRFPIIESQQLVANRNVAAFRSVLDIDGNHTAVIVIDVRPPRRRNDREAFNEIYAVVQRETLPFIICGDFNVPGASRHLQRAMEGMQSSFLEAPSDWYQATWPAVAPLWHIDHAFHSDGLTTTRAAIIRRRASDHFPIRVEYDLSGPSTVP